MTNVIAFLHTTAAYQAVALQLMTAEANFIAEQLGIPERLALQTNRLRVAEVGPSPRGVNGAVGNSNYVFGFDWGLLKSVKKVDGMKRLGPGITNLNQLTNVSSRIDTNGAYQLATQWLANLSVNVAVLEQRFPRQVIQVTVAQAAMLEPGQARRRVISNARLPVPMFLVSWGEGPSSFDMRKPVRMRILGTTPELLELNIRDRSLFKRPPLTITNAGELLAPWPTPADIVRGLFGAEAGVTTVAEPKEVQLWVLNSRFREGEESLPETRAGPVRLSPRQQKQLSKLLLDFETYQWGAMKLCSPDYGVKARFVRGNLVIEVLFCFECDILQITRDGFLRTENFDFHHNALVKLMREIFPRDRKIRTLELNPDEKQARERFEKMWLEN